MCLCENCTISIGKGNDGPRISNIFDSSTIQINYFAIIATIFSLRRAPPPPFIKVRLLSTASAPSIATSICSISSRVVSGIFNFKAYNFVASLVGTHTMFSNSPDYSFYPTLSTA